MKIKCDYCGNYINDYDEKCSSCGAVNTHLVRNSNQAPKTIEELKKWYIDKNLPDENTTRFFIGKDYKKPKAFGIYKDELTGNYIVYKNKADGTRAVRYEGKDEAYAVNELYIKLKEEIVNQKSHNLHNSGKSTRYQTRGISLGMVILIFYLLIIFIIAAVAIRSPKRGYYSYNNNYYYYQNGSWYEYDDYNGWKHSTAPKDLKKHHSGYYDSSSYYSSYGIDDFEDSGYYVEPSSSSSDWDSSSSWDSSDSWDSGSSDWDSDW